MNGSIDRRHFLATTAIGSSALVGSASLLLGCRTESSELTANGLTRVRLALNWFPEPEHGGFYAAALAGDFAAEGLSVEIVPGGPGTKVIPQLVRGSIEFGIGSADQVLVQRGQEADVVALLAPLQTSPRCVMVHAESGIDSFDKLRDVTLAVGAGQPFVKFLQRHASLDGVRIVPYGGRIGPFLSDPKQAQQGYVFSEPIFARREGVAVNVLMLADLGFDPYTSCVIADRRYLDANPQVAERFLRACIRGWRRYLGDPAAVNAELLKLNRELDATGLEGAHAALVPLCRTPTGRPFGSMETARWKTLRDQLVELDFVPQATDIDGAWRDPPQVSNEAGSGFKG